MCIQITVNYIDLDLEINVINLKTELETYIYLGLETTHYTAFITNQLSDNISIVINKFFCSSI